MKGDVTSHHFWMLWFQRNSLDTVGFRTFRTFFLFLWLFLRFLIFLCFVFRCGGETRWLWRKTGRKSNKERRRRTTLGRMINLFDLITKIWTLGTLFTAWCMNLNVMKEDIPQVTPTTMILGKVKVKAETIFEHEAMRKESETISGYGEGAMRSIIKLKVKIWYGKTLEEMMI